MKLSEWANVAEIVSAVAVVTTLLYVGLEINQNTRAIQSGTHQALLDSAQELDYLKLANPHILEAVLKAESGVESLTVSELEIFNMYAQMTFSKWENIFLNHEQGLLDTDLWLGYSSSYETLLDVPAYVRFWEQRRNLYVPSFRAFVDSEVSSD